MSETREPELDKPNCAPGRNRTYDTRFRKPVLYPLSYEGGACVKRGRKPVAELRSSFGTPILAVGRGVPAACPGGMGALWVVWTGWGRASAPSGGGEAGGLRRLGQALSL